MRALMSQVAHLQQELYRQRATGGSARHEELRVFCLTHEVGFMIPRGTRQITCALRGEVIGEGLPFAGQWLFCCACERFLPLSIHNISACPSCERQWQRFFLCDQCHVLSAAITCEVGTQSTCPGCLMQTTVPKQPHACQAFGQTLLTARAVCLYCQETIQEQEPVPSTGTENEITDEASQGTAEEVDEKLEEEAGHSSTEHATAAPTPSPTTNNSHALVRRFPPLTKLDAAALVPGLRRRRLLRWALGGAAILLFLLLSGWWWLRSGSKPIHPTIPPLSRTALLEVLKANAPRQERPALIEPIEILAAIKQRGVAFQLAGEDEAAFRQAGATPELLAALRANVRTAPHQIETDPTRQAYQLLYLGQLKEGLTAARAAVQKTPQQAQAHAVLASALLADALEAEAEKAARHSLQLDARNALAQTVLGALHHLHYRATEAEQALQKALTFDPGNLEARGELASLYQQQERFAEAEREAVRGLLSDSKGLFGLTMLGDAYLAQRQTTEARRLYETSLTTTPTYPPAQLGLANWHAQEKRLTESIATLQKLLAQGQPIYAAKILLARGLGHQQNFAEAHQLLEQVLTEATEQRPWISSWAQAEKGVLYASQQQENAADNAFTMALRLNPDSPLAQSGRGYLYLPKRQWDAAETAFRAALQLDPFFVAAHWGLGLCHIGRRQRAGAQKEYEFLLPRNQEAAAALGKLIRDTWGDGTQLLPSPTPKSRYQSSPTPQPQVTPLPPTPTPTPRPTPVPTPRPPTYSELLAAAEAELNAGNLRNAANLTQQAIQLQPNRGDGHLQYANILLREGSDWRATAAAFRTALRYGATISFAVVHHHFKGRCSGTIILSHSLFAYRTTHEDAFETTYAEVKEANRETRDGGPGFHLKYYRLRDSNNKPYNFYMRSWFEADLLAALVQGLR